MAVKMKSKGTALFVSMSSVYTAIPELEKIDRSGSKTETYEARPLDIGASAYGTQFHQNGYSSPPKITAEGFYDAVNAVHAALLLLSWTPVALTPFNTNFKITYTNASPVSEIWAVPGVGFDVNVDSPKGVRFKLDLQCTGDPS